MKINEFIDRFDEYNFLVTSMDSEDMATLLDCHSSRLKRNVKSISTYTQVQFAFKNNFLPNN